MSIIAILFQIVIALGIFNVWLLRSSRATPYRGKDAPSLKSEFAAYGLSESIFYTVGVLKLAAALMLLLGISCNDPISGFTGRRYYGDLDAGRCCYAHKSQRSN